MSGFISSLLKKRHSPTVEEEGSQMNFGLARVFKYEELKKATNSFNTELGKGGYGKVYLGKLQDGQKVAKVLSDCNPKQLEQFFNEVTSLSRLRHKNLVSLYGCTSPRSQKLLLVYEYAPNGTVADHLHRKRTTLTWAMRVQIATETAEALAYLHALEPPIIHRDVKTSNILLDNEFHVKVADLGICRLLPWDSSHVTTLPQGTMGDRDPEYERYFRLTDKTDVYSFGVVLMELISAQQAVDVNRDPEDIYLDRMALDKILNKKLDEFVDPKLGYHSNNDVRRMIDSLAELASNCLQQKGGMRPPMVHILTVLKGIQNEIHQLQPQEEVILKGIQKMSLQDGGQEEVNLKEIQNEIHQMQRQDCMQRQDGGQDEVNLKGIHNFTSRVLSVGKYFTFAELRQATHNFDEKAVIHVGRFSKVYFAELKDGSTVAVKRRNPSFKLEINEFQTETYEYQTETHEYQIDIHTMSKLRHRRLVSLIGYCNENSEIILVYEYVPNGTVADHLHIKKTTLTWAMRVQIATETAEALAYLRALEPPIIHRDVKTSNILLDNEFHVKVADLDMCRVLPWDISHVSTMPQGTLGYRYPYPSHVSTMPQGTLGYRYPYPYPSHVSTMPQGTLGYRNPYPSHVSTMPQGTLGYRYPYPEYTDKTDAYSFGVVLMELISAQKTVDVNRDLEDIYLDSMSLDKILNKKLDEFVDPILGYHSNNDVRRMINSLAKLASHCLQPMGAMRPPMVHVLTVLKGIQNEIHQI